MIAKMTIEAKGKIFLIALTFLVVSFTGYSSQTNAQTKDPSDSATNGYHIRNYSWKGRKGRVTYPSNMENGKRYPLVIILRGYGFGYDEYKYLQKHLARNGFITASVDVVAGDLAEYNVKLHKNAADEAWDFVADFLFNNWSRSNQINPQSIAIVGHSQGGTTARYLAHKLSPFKPFINVRSVVAMAPSDMLNQDFLSGDQTTGFLQLYGTADGDTSPYTVFEQYDNAGTNGSQSAFNSVDFYKAVKLISGASHLGYSDRQGPWAIGPNTDDQRDLVKGYILAFLSAHNRSNWTWHDSHIQGEAVAGDWSAAVYTSFRGLHRFVIDNFDNEGLYRTSNVYFAMEGSADVPHDTGVLYAFNNQFTRNITWAIPNGKRDVRGFKYLSLRISQFSDQEINDLFVRIRNGTTWSQKIRLTDHGEIPKPISMDEDGSVHPMATIRIPLENFGPHNDVNNVRIQFEGDANGKVISIDDLEFSDLNWFVFPFQPFSLKE